MKVNVEMTLGEETAERIKEVAKRIAVMNFRDGDTLLAASVLECLADEYARKAKALTVESEASDVQRDLLPGPE